VFVRLTGCPLRCQYCDTAYAFTGGEWRSFEEIEAEIRKHGTRFVCVTGGEPLAQPRCTALLTALCDSGFDVSLETSGAHDIAPVDTRVARVVDVKTPGSREAHRNRWDNLALLTPHDALKFVICDRADYEWARSVLAERFAAGGPPCPVFFSPSYEQVAAGELADWILADRLAVRLQVQLHKVLWGNVPGR
jgi:7-carboxy-7-deazaguanine synthase